MGIILLAWVGMDTNIQSDCGVNVVNNGAYYKLTFSFKYKKISDSQYEASADGLASEKILLK